MAGEEVPMGLRRTIVEIDPSTLNVTEFCRTHGVSTWTFWSLRRRYRAEGLRGLEPRSRAAHLVANKTPAVVEDAVVAMRKKLLEAGLDAGPASIAWHLRDLAGVPSESTIWRILKAGGFVVAQPAKAPKRAVRSFTAQRANECWQLDDTTWELADGTPVKILNIVDDHSRLAVACAAMGACTGTATLAVLAAAAAVIGWPARFLSDNAPAFRHILADALAVLGIAAGHSRPYHPQTNGKVERFHQTLKRWLARQPRARTITELQTQLDTFRALYNHHRPHRSLGRRYPAQVWIDAPKSGPADRPLGAATRIHTGHIHGGRISLGLQHRVSVGAAHDGQPALAIVTGTRCHIFVDGTLVRALTIDTTRRNQPLYDKPGRPGRLP